MDDQITALQKLVKEALDTKLKPVSLGQVLHQLCLERAFLEWLSEFLLREEKSVLGVSASHITRWRAWGICKKWVARLISRFSTFISLRLLRLCPALVRVLSRRLLPRSACSSLRPGAS